MWGSCRGHRKSIFGHAWNPLKVLASMHYWHATDAIEDPLPHNVLGKGYL